MLNANKLTGEAAHPERVARWLIFLGGVVGPILFVVAFTVDGLLRPGYSPIHQAISDLGVGPNGNLMDAIAGVLGVLWIYFGMSFARIVRPVVGRGWLWLGSAFLTLRGVAFITVAIFTEAPATVHIHSFASIIGLISLLGAFLAIGIALHRNALWRGWGNYSLVACLVTLLLIAVEFLAFTPGTLLAPARLGGLIERLLYIETLAWYVAFGWRLIHTSAGN